MVNLVVGTKASGLPLAPSLGRPLPGFPLKQAHSTWQHDDNWQLRSHGFLELVISENKSISLREVPARIPWRTLACVHLSTIPFGVSGGWSTLPGRPESQAQPQDVRIQGQPHRNHIQLAPSLRIRQPDSRVYHTLGWRGVAHQRKVSRQGQRLQPVTKNQLDQRGKESGTVHQELNL